LVEIHVEEGWQEARELPWLVLSVLLIFRKAFLLSGDLASGNQGLQAASGHEAAESIITGKTPVLGVALGEKQRLAWTRPTLFLVTRPGS
jgi:hypothetical protein